jgi:hypothetical protein
MCQIKSTVHWETLIQKDNTVESSKNMKETTNTDTVAMTNTELAFNGETIFPRDAG